MAQSKHQEFPAGDQRLAAVAKALSHPARIAILRSLARRGICMCGEIVDMMPLSQSTVSQHLKALKGAGLISGTVEGPKSCYCVNGKSLAALGKTLVDLMSGLCRDAAKCC